MGTNNVPVEHSDQAKLLEESNSPPEGSFTTAWLLGNRGFFRINITIIRPQPEEPQGYLPLSRRQAENSIKCVTDIIKLLKKELR